jgi:hypothetical protein
VLFATERQIGAESRLHGHAPSNLAGMGLLQ